MLAAEQRAQAILKRVPSGVVCEIGVYAASLSRILLRAGLTVYMIDPWSGESSQAYKDTGDVHAKMGDEEQDRCFTSTQSIVRKYEKGHIVRKFSKDAVTDFPDGFFDLVFIDGDHSYEGCREDILNYLPKVKKGGYISGHDYDHGEDNQQFTFGVNQAVDELIEDPEFDLNTTWFKKI